VAARRRQRHDEHCRQLRDELDERGTKPVIPNRSNRKQPYSFSKRLYKLRWRIESAFNRLKDAAHRNPLRQAGAKLPGFCLHRRSSCMVDLMSLGPSTTLADLAIELRDRIHKSVFQ
jgi:hypothetical protein